MTDARIKFFEMERCGYYRYRSRHPAFGSLVELLDDLAQWVDGKAISETTTYEPTDEQDENLLHTYCYSIRSNDAGDVLLTTWNETATTEGAVASVNLTGSVESADIETSDIPEGYAAGYPAYFWFPSGVDGYATIQIGNRLNGRNNLHEFICGFLRNYSQWVVYDDDNDDPDVEIILGYSATGESDDIDSAKPYFKASQWKKNGNLDFIRSSRSEIHKMVRRDELNFMYEESVSFWQSIWRSFAGEDTSPTLRGTHRLSLEVDFTPDEAELERVINHWEEDHENVVGQFQDIGFKLHGDQRVHWLSKSLASEIFDLDVQFSDGPLADSNSLLEQLQLQRTQILALLSEDGNGE